VAAGTIPLLATASVLLLIHEPKAGAKETSRQTTQDTEQRVRP
jgi:hypothetical protein